MKLSVIIPVYRVEGTLDRCVQSVIRQSFSDFELILVDDGSPDACPAMCDAWARRDRRISVVHQQNGGLSAARNAGLQAAKGDFVTFVDSDDYLSTDTYAAVMPVAETCDIVEFPFCRMDGDRQVKRLQLPDRTYDGPEGMADYWLKERVYEHCYAWNKVYRRSLFDDVRFPCGQVFEDVATLPRLISQARQVRTVSSGMYYYCTNSQGITATATGADLAQLLEHHLQQVPWRGDRYYMHLVDLQLDVNRLTGQPPRLYRQRVHVFSAGLRLSQILKAIIINTLGLNALCKIHPTLRKH